MVTSGCDFQNKTGLLYGFSWTYTSFDPDYEQSCRLEDKVFVLSNINIFIIIILLILYFVVPLALDFKKSPKYDV